MEVVFRADASLKMGSGHVMRCLTLADALRLQGIKCSFICREHPGNLIELIRGKGFPVEALPLPAAQASDIGSLSHLSELSHSSWLGVSQHRDARDSTSVIDQLQPDWLIIDHYALDERWEKALASHCRNIMVIDDLADRSHQCQVLLDQTFQRNPMDYALLVPKECVLLCGSQYALLRPEFTELRPHSLQRRQIVQLKNILVTMGGVDKDNVTGQVLDALAGSGLPDDCKITVVMGSTAPWLEDVRRRAMRMSLPTEVRVGVSDMAQLMADSDLAIGAAGGTSWERCCLGLPTIMIVLAENQKAIAQALITAGAAFVAESAALEIPSLIDALHNAPLLLTTMSASAAEVADGLGVFKVIAQLNS